MDVNTCLETTLAYHTIALYSHSVPIALALFLSVFAMFRTKFSQLSLVFFAFCSGFSLWLVSDVIVWTTTDYYQVYFWWSWLDFVAIVFFVCGSYFFTYLTKGRVPIWEKLFYVLVCVVPFAITVSGTSLLTFEQAVCEASNNPLLTTYKLWAEIAIMLVIPWTILSSWNKLDRQARQRTILVASAILLFFLTFTIGEQVSDTTGVYEIILYGLFVLPLFLIIMMYAITNLEVFAFRLLGSQILAYALIIMTGSQLLFIQDSTQTTLSIVTLAISLFFGVLLLQNSQKEEQARIRIETLAKQLDEANSRQVVLIHFITHQIKGFVTKSRNIFSMILEGDFGPVPETMRPMIQEGYNSDTKGASTIQEILNASNIKSGKVTYKAEPFDLKALIDEIVKDLKGAADAKGLVINANTGSEPVTFTGDRVQLQNAFKNLIDNSIKYTPKGEVAVTLTKEADKIRFEQKDTGVGITAEDMKNLFTEGGHGKESIKVNVESTGFGLYIAKNIIDAHKGKVWAESEGAGKGSCFIVELPA